MGIFKHTVAPTSKMRKQTRMRDRIENAPPAPPERGMMEWKKARNLRRKHRVRAVKKLDALNRG